MAGEPLDRDALVTELTARWHRLVPADPGLGTNLVGRYGEPGRYYHDVTHLAEVLGHIDTLADAAEDVEAVRLAAWFHDAVYDVRAGDNEEQSATLAEVYLVQAGFEPDLVTEVGRLVRLTSTHAAAAGDGNGAVLCDADLAILASSPERYASYTKAVRQEYAWVPDHDFRRGRAAVLRQLLELPTLFHTTYALAHWDQPARANLDRELDTLDPP